MDTPEKTQIATPISSKFEDSPVFNYINSLSPIKPVKSIHTTQTFNSPSFASPPSTFTSPNISSLKETRSFKRNCLTDPSRPEFSYCENEDNPSEGVSGAVQQSDLCTKQLRYLSHGSSSREIPIGAYNESSKLAIALPKSLKYDCGVPDVNTSPGNNSKAESVPEMAGTPASLIKFAADGSKEKFFSFENAIELGKIGQIDQNEETSGEWEKLVSEAADLLIFDSFIIEETSDGQDSKAMNSGTTSCASTVLELPQDNNGSLQKTKAIGSCEELDMESHVTLSGEVANVNETDQAPEIFYSTLLNVQIINPSNPEVNDDKDNCVHSGCKIKPGFSQQRSIRRLVFEMSGVNKRRSICDYSCGSSISLQAECNITLNENQMVSTKPEKGYSSSMIPRIGLHLNALASTSNDINLVEHETLASGRQLRRMPSSSSSLNPLLYDKEGPNMSLNQNFAEGNEVQVMEDATSAFEVIEEFNQGSPKKKRSKSEQAAGSDACKRCNCKKSKCLKLYCECFAAGLYCVELCSCQDCFNKPTYEDTVLDTRKQIESRNPLAFAPKVIMSSESFPEFGDESNKTPSSARHKRGCNCKKSSCLKKYCECFQGGVGCSIGCRCEGCKNPFGCKYGTEETEIEMEETDSSERNASNLSLQDNVLQKGEKKSDLVLPLIPSSEIRRSLVRLPCFFSGKPPQSSLFGVESPRICTSENPEKTEFSHCLPKFEKRLQMIPEDEIPEILQDNCSPTEGVKSTSPNSKRVSPPHLKPWASPAWRGGRKLILRSIPSFPSLTPQHENIKFSGQPS